MFTTEPTSGRAQVETAAERALSLKRVTRYPQW
jgi:hypothetical protein